MGNNTAANNWAIVVGVNDYDFLPETSLRFAVKDALAMKAFLREEAGFPEKQVLLCGDGSSGTRKATRPILRDILLHQIQHARNADNLWFFFSGHGLGEHLMPIDGNPNDLPDTAISIHFVTERLRACKAKNIVLVLDMCRNEHHEVGQKSAVSVADALKKLVQDREGQQGIITLFSCGRGESSYEIASLEQGAFTHALLEGLKQQTILKGLETYLARRVPELHSLEGKTRKQVPLVIPEPGWKYDEPILSHYATAIDVARLKEMAIDAESDGETDKAIRLWEQVNLFATEPNDRRRALNRIRHLMGRSEPAKTVAPKPPAPISPITYSRGETTASTPPTPTPPVTYDRRETTASVPPQPATYATDSRTSKATATDIDSIPLESEKGIDYRKLRDLLKEGKWEEADRETLQVMLQAANRESVRYLDGNSLKHFSCVDLRTIDQLWVSASNGHFGFSVQKKIWDEYGSPMSTEKDWDSFCIAVGWKDSGATKYLKYDELLKNPLISPEGEIPVFGDFFRGLVSRGLLVESWFALFSRRDL
jgi:GUN4-like/Caspase domain